MRLWVQGGLGRQAKLSEQNDLQKSPGWNGEALATSGTCAWEGAWL